MAQSDVVGTRKRRAWGIGGRVVYVAGIRKRGRRMYTAIGALILAFFFHVALVL